MFLTFEKITLYPRASKFSGHDNYSNHDYDYFRHNWQWLVIEKPLLHLQLGKIKTKPICVRARQMNKINLICSDQPVICLNKISVFKQISYFCPKKSYWYGRIAICLDNKAKCSGEVIFIQTNRNLYRRIIYFYRNIVCLFGGIS